jgi:asparagine synthase (glutamine-hydrolysing)
LSDELQNATVAHRGGDWNVESARVILEEYLRHDIDNQFVSEYLTKVDGGTMHFALEARAPFFDQELWEFAASLPATLRVHEGELKAILRAIARRRIGPRVAGLRKQGFAVPVQRWLAGRWRPTLEGALRDSELERRGWIRTNKARELLEHVPRGGQVPKQLWYMFVLEQWLSNEEALTTEKGMRVTESRSSRSDQSSIDD